MNPETKKINFHAWHLYIIKLPSVLESKRDLIMNKMQDAKISLSLHYKPLHMHSYWKKSLNLKNELFPNSTKTFRSSISLPIYPTLKEEEILEIVSNLKKIIKNV